MVELKRTEPPSVADNRVPTLRPEDTIPEMANAAMLKALLAKFPTPAIDTRKFTIIHGLLQSLNHTETNLTYMDTSLLVELMDRVSGKSVNVDGALFKNLFAYLMHPTYIIQGMPQMAGATEDKPGILSRLWGSITGRGQPQTQEQKT